MLKKYFTDGLIQIALLLSLLRTDLNHLNSYISNNDYPELQEIIMGQTVAYTPTQIQSPYGYNSLGSDGGYSHIKNIDNYNNHDYGSVFSDLHALSQYRRFDGIETDVNTWLVSHPNVVTLPEPAHTADDAQSTTQQGQTQTEVNNNSIQGSQSQDAQNESTSSTHQELLEAVPTDWTEVFPGIGLTKEDMDLIEILWRQDIDLGVSREMYDLNLRRELERERQLEQQKLEEKEKEASLLSEEISNSQGLANNYIVDGETGEVVPAPENQEAPLGSQNEPQFSIEDAMRILEIQAEEGCRENGTLQDAGEPEAPSIPELVDELEAAIQTQSGRTNLSRQNSLEQRWQDVANILELQQSAEPVLPPLMEQDGASMMVLDPIPHNALIHNATLAPHPSAAITPLDIQPLVSSGFTPLSTPNVTGNFLYSNASMSGGSYGGVLMDQNSTDTTLPFVNATEPMAPPSVSFNGTSSLLHSLMVTDMEDMDFGFGDLEEAADSIENVKMDDNGSDSAVSLGSGSPYNEGSNSSSSPFEGLEGATGGDDMKNKYTNELHKYEHDYSYEEFHYGRSLSTNYSTSSNETEHKYNVMADPRHVHHNHSYPMQPGQTPREKKEKERFSYSRDEKKAKSVGLPWSVDDIINSPQEDFSDMLQKGSLTEAQMQLMRDIRRRGKNKMAAQNCRKRKMGVITTLEEDVEELRREKAKLVRQRQLLEKKKNDIGTRLSHLHNEVFSNLRDDHGQPYDPSEYTLQHTADGEVFLVPRNQTTVESHKEKAPKKRKNAKKGM